MGTAISIDIRDPVDHDIVDELVRWFHQVDATYSTYRPESPISEYGLGHTTRVNSRPKSSTSSSSASRFASTVTAHSIHGQCPHQTEAHSTRLASSKVGQSRAPPSGSIPAAARTTASTPVATSSFAAPGPALHGALGCVTPTRRNRSWGRRRLGQLRNRDLRGLRTTRPHHRSQQPSARDRPR